MAQEQRSERTPSRPRRWFNWPLVLALAVNLTIWVALAYWVLHGRR
jgi:hypothetical protein